jgi:hypothetical protein
MPEPKQTNTLYSSTQFRNTPKTHPKQTPKTPLPTCFRMIVAKKWKKRESKNKEKQIYKTKALSPTFHNLKNATHHKSRLLNKNRPAIRANTSSRDRIAMCHAHTLTHVHVEVHIEIHVHGPRLHKVQTLSLNGVLITATSLLAQGHVHG